MKAKTKLTKLWSFLLSLVMLLSLLPTTALAAMMAGGTATPDPRYSHIQLKFSEDYTGSSDRILLRDCEYITASGPNAIPKLLPADELEQVEFAQNGDYVALYYNGSLHLKGNLRGACIDMQAARYSDAHVKTMMIYVRDNVTLDGKSCLLYGYDQHLWLRITPGKTLTINADRNQLYKYRAAIYSNGGDVTVSGGGTLNINYQGKTNPGESEYKIVEGIYGSRVSFEYDDNSLYLGSPTVNINMNNGESGPEGDAVTGISAGTLTVKDDAKLNIEVTGRALNTSNNSTTGEGYYSGTSGRVNMAISASSMELLDNASVDITSHKNVFSDIYLFSGGEALTVDTTGHLNILNEGNIQRYDPEIPTQATYALYRDYPTYNIYFPEQNATANLVRAEGGVSITSYSAVIDDWYEKYYTKGEEDAYNWAIGCRGADPQLGTGMHRGSLRIGDSVNVTSNSWIHNQGSIQYIWAPQGVATVKKSPGLTMDSHAPADNPLGSQLYYAKVMEPKFNDIHVVPKGGSVVLVGGEDIAKGEFLYWYDALHPTGTETGTSWTESIKTFDNIQQDMVLVPVRDPMKTGPTLSDVGYSVQNNNGTYTRYAYQDLTFATEDNISDGTGGYRVMLVPAQLPRYGENTYAVKDLKGSPVMGLRNSRLYADKNARFADGTSLDWQTIPTGSYRIAYDDEQTGRCFFSKPFTFDPPIAPPYIDPITQIYDATDGGTKTVKITAERNATIRYRLWDYTKNQWGTLNSYTGPFDVNVTTAQDVRIKAYAGPIIKEITSEVRYAMQPTGKPTVKYGDTVVSDGNRQYFYDSIELTVQAPDGYEVYYRVSQQPYESSSDGIVGTKVENGKVTITDSGNGSIYFKLAKAFTVGGAQYLKMSHNYAAVRLTKLTELPTPMVTVTTKEGGQTLIPSGNTYTMTENVVTVELEPYGSWPLNATIAYDTNGNATPRLSQSYTGPFDVRGAGTLSVFTLAPKANGEYNFAHAAYTFKLDSSLEWVPVSTYKGNCTAYYTDESGAEQEITGFSQALKVGTRVRVVPNPPAGQVFKKWEISNYDEYNIWGAYGGNELYNPELIFYVPKPKNDYSGKPLTLSITATFGTAAEANISGETKVDLVMSKTVGESISLNYNNKEMRTISCQWWVGDSAGAEDDALPGAVTFDPDKTYTVKVTIKANPGASFANTAGVAIGSWGEHFTVPNNKITRTNDTLTFTATPIRQIDLTMPAPLTVGDPLPTAAQIGGLPAGVTVQKLTWPYITTGGNTVPETNDGTVRAALTLKTDGTHPILVGEYKFPTVNGEEYMYDRNGNSGNYYTVTNGSTVTVGNIDLPVKPKGVEVNGTITSYGSDSESVTVQLIESGASEPAYETIVKGNSAAYSIEGVASGTYTMKVMKKNHVAREYTVTVGSSNVVQDVEIWLLGDVNGDGTINVKDKKLIFNHLNDPSGALTGYALDVGDVNRDGTINVKDKKLIFNHLKGISLWS